MKEITLNASTGRGLGTGPARQTRRDGALPAVAYGMGTDAISLTVDRRELRHVLSTDAGVNVLLNLNIDSDKNHLALVKEIQRHPVRREVLHVDFLLIDPDKDITVDVPVVLVGEPKHVLQVKGIAEQQTFTVSINVRPQSIPNHLEVDISEMYLDTVIAAGSLELPAGATLNTDEHEVLVNAQLTRAGIMAQQLARSGGDGEDAPAEGAGE